jgi:hypothetical protein
LQLSEKEALDKVVARFLKALEPYNTKAGVGQLARWAKQRQSSLEALTLIPVEGRQISCLPPEDQGLGHIVKSISLDFDDQRLPQMVMLSLGSTLVALRPTDGWFEATGALALNNGHVLGPLLDQLLAKLPPLQPQKARVSAEAKQTQVRGDDEFRKA